MKYVKYVKVFFFLFLLIILLIGCKSNTNIKVEVLNNLNKNISNKVVSVQLSKFSKFNIDRLSAYDNRTELPSQLVDANGDGQPDSFIFLVNLGPKEKKIISIKESDKKKKFPQRAHAEISVKRNYKLVNGIYTGGYFESVKKTKTPEGHIDHNLYYKCEGPCWESDKASYRLYLDERNAIDIFGKKVNKIVLPNVGHTYNKTGNEMYHEMADWGMDIFKVGNSLGIGSFAAFVDGNVEMVSKDDSTICIISNDGPLLASVNTKYYGWKFGNQKNDLEVNLSIVAGSRLTKCDITVSGDYPLYCTGLAKHSGTEFIKSEHKNGWNYIALWGNQTVIHDSLGIVVFYHNKYHPTLTEDELSYIVTLTPIKQKIEYYFAACWEQEPNGINTKDEFVKFMDDEIEMLNNPITINFVNIGN